MKSTRHLFMFMLLILSVFIIGCASEPSESDVEDSNDDAAGEGTEDSTGGDLIISSLSEAVSLDVHGSNDTYSSNVASNIYETLISSDENLELQPGLALSWEQLEDTVWEFKLREGVTFHDGSDFNADVVKANIERVLDPEIGSQRAFLYDMISDVNVIDEYTVQLITEYPFAPLPAHIAHDGGGIMSAEMIQKDYDAMEEGANPGTVINEKPIGTGYFKFDEWQSGQYIRLSRNDDYWGEPAKLDTVTFKVVPEDLTRIAELETGDTHISDPLNPNDFERVNQTDGLFVDATESVALIYLGFNTEKEPFDDPRVRKAFFMAVNKEEIVEGIYNGIGLTAKSPLAPKVFGYDDNISEIEYDPEAAKELLAEAGYEDGLSVTFWTSDEREREDIAAYVQASLEEIGVDASIQVSEWGAFLDQTANGEHEMFILSWSTVTGDADYGLYSLFHSSNVGASGNRTFTKDDSLDEILAQARRSVDEDERLELYKEAQNALADEAIILPIIHQDYLLGVNESVKGLWQHPTRKLRLHDVTLE